MIKLIIFDLDGVYFFGGSKRFIEVLSERYNLSKEEIIEVYKKSEEILKYKKGLINGDEFWNFALKKWNLDIPISEILNLLKITNEFNNELHLIVKKLKDLNFMIGIGSNNFKERIDLLENQFKFLEEFQYLFLSYLIGKIKPEQSYFSHILENTKLKSYEILFVDDSKENLNKLNEMGFKTIHFDNNKQFIENLQDILGFKL